MSANMHKLNDVIEHYKRHINKACAANDNDKIMYCITKLTRLPITVQNLQKTGIGRVVNSLRKDEGNIGEAAKTLVLKWKNVVKVEESENFYQRDDNSGDEHYEVSSTNDNEELQISQNITSSVASTSYYNKSIESNLPNETNESDSNNSSDQESSHRRHSDDKTKYKKIKKEKDCKKRKDSDSSHADDHRDGHSSKKVKREHKYDKHDSAKHKKHSTNEHETKVSSSKSSIDKKYSESSVKKEKKSSHSDSKKDKHKSESKSHKDKSESKSSHRDKSESKKSYKEKTSNDSKPSTSSSISSKTFEEALLGFPVLKKKNTKTKNREMSSRSSSSENEFSPPPTHSNLAPLSLDPEELIANYKPLPQLERKKKITADDIDPLASIMTTKNMRTKVYSGNKSTYYTEVPKLHDICVQIIKDNLDALEYTGGVPFVILEPILKYATADQLYRLEQYNEYLIEDTGSFWEFHCKKEFRNKVPEDDEPWRDFYIRCLQERETKLARLRQNINANQAASTPVRKTQMAFLNSTVKPPRNIANKQAKYHAASETKINILNKSMMGEHSTAESLSANRKSTAMATGTAISLSASSATPPGIIKKRKAPLMQKALQLIKSRYKR
ncbi:transcription elongation factor B polypeptide 3 [Adelges cooleyi]|uniref:transcription elongation factor B polypeptide 3 n=1 Tax=Adelges cooleyi TaxID=133065 RepID=UPI0021804B79|nr:transcription elongation factor B polypeptide 3 [Adelges cooleyi]